MKSKTLAISAISASLIALILTLGAYVEITDVFCIVISSVFVILPLYYKSYWGSFLAYLAGGILAFMFSGFNVLSIVFPSYIAFFGIFPLIKFLTADKGVNRWIIYFVGLIWCVGAGYGLYFYYTMVMDMNFNDLPMWVSNNILYFVGALGVVFYVIYERYVHFAKMTMDKLLMKIIK